jgi:AraC-like DNA-binding protein
LSRSAFAARFIELLRDPAMHHVTRWRIHTALTWLKEDDAPAAEQSRRLGYESEAAFSRNAMPVSRPARPGRIGTRRLTSPC